MERPWQSCHWHWWPNLEHAHPFKTLSLSLSPPELWLSDAKKLLVRQLFLTTTTQTRPFLHFYDDGGIFPENLKQKVSFSSECEKFSFEWRWRRQKRAAVVQWLARSSHNWGVRGSNPAATFFLATLRGQAISAFRKVENICVEKGYPTCVDRERIKYAEFGS